MREVTKTKCKFPNNIDMSSSQNCSRHYAGTRETFVSCESYCFRKQVSTPWCAEKGSVITACSTRHGGIPWSTRPKDVGGGSHCLVARVRPKSGRTNVTKEVRCLEEPQVTTDVPDT